MRSIDVTLKDLMQLARNKMTIFFLVIVPIIFTLLLGFIFGAGGDGDTRLPVGWIDLDGSVASAQLRVLLDGSAAIRVVEVKNEETAQKQVLKGDLAVTVIVPAGYGDAIWDGDQALRPALLIDETNLNGHTARNSVQTAVARLNSAVQAAQLSAEAFAAQSAFADETARQVFLYKGIEQAVAAWGDPALTVKMAQPQPQDDPKPPSQSGFAHSSPANMVQFSMMGVIGMAEIVLQERKSRTLQRMLTTAMSRAQIALGHFIAIFALSMLQLILMIAFGALALNVNYLHAPLATLVVMVAQALWTSAIGLFIGVISKSDEQVAMFSIIPTLVLAGIGGAWMPLEFTSKTFQAIGHLSPVAWAMDGFENIVIRGLGIESVLLPAGVLLAYAVVFLALAVWRFRAE
ncbi:MAG: ABC transporter permease [Anaerolineae bacterium]|nr:ABC transporter permease [Anaerolineae bacterium]